MSSIDLFVSRSKDFALLNLILEIYSIIEQCITFLNFLHKDTFDKITNEFLDEVREDNGVIPGSLEVAKMAENSENGWELDPVLYDTLDSICKDLDIDLSSYAA